MPRVGEVIVDFPQDQPLFGWEEELKMRVGSTVEVVKVGEELTRTKFLVTIKEETDGPRVYDGLIEFRERHPGTLFTTHLTFR